MLNEDIILDKDDENKSYYTKTLTSKNPKPNNLLDIKSIILSFFISILIFLSFNLLGFKNVSVHGQSMVPTLNDGDKLILSNLFYNPSINDIVVFKPTLHQDELYIKRIIAKEDQKIYIDIDKRDIYVDDVLLEDEFSKISTTMGFDIENPIIVPKDHYFVLGDNRDGSLDSRYKEVGMVSKESILGKVVFRFWPFNKIGIF